MYTEQICFQISILGDYVLSKCNRKDTERSAKPSQAKPIKPILNHACSFFNSQIHQIVLIEGCNFLFSFCCSGINLQEKFQNQKPLSPKIFQEWSPRQQHIKSLFLKMCGHKRTCSHCFSLTLSLFPARQVFVNNVQAETKSFLRNIFDLLMMFRVETVNSLWCAQDIQPNCVAECLEHTPSAVHDTSNKMYLPLFSVHSFIINHFEQWKKVKQGQTSSLTNTSLL